MSEKSIYDEMRDNGMSRRDFVKFCGLVSSAIWLNSKPILDAGGKVISRKSDLTKFVAKSLKAKSRLPIIWLEFQDCAGCTEALTRSQNPTLVDLVLNQITIEYDETLSAAAGFQVEEAKKAAIQKYMGQYVLVVEGSIPTGDDGVYCTIAGQSSLDILNEAVAGAAAVIADGNCASFGGLPKAKPNPTSALGVMDIVKDKPLVNIPGCPAIPEVFTAVVANFLIFGTFPELDELLRPMTFYGNTVHDHCMRRPFYEAGKFATSFDDENAKLGYCLYKLGCKGPTTYNACASLKWCGGLSYPVQSGHPCLGCSQPNFWDGGGFYQGQSAPLEKPTLVAAGAALAAGAVAGAGIAVANDIKKKSAKKKVESATKEVGEKEKKEGPK